LRKGGKQPVEEEEKLFFLSSSLKNLFKGKLVMNAWKKPEVRFLFLSEIGNMIKLFIPNAI
jgi:hypothetical protein